MPCLKIITVRNSVAGEELRGYIERIERLREEKKELAEDEKLVMAEAKNAGFDTKMIRHCIKVRAAKPSDVEEARALEDLYLSALGMRSELPLFRSIDLMNVRCYRQRAGGRSVEAVRAVKRRDRH